MSAEFCWTTTPFLLLLLSFLFSFLSTPHQKTPKRFARSLGRPQTHDRFVSNLSERSAVQLSATKEEQAHELRAIAVLLFFSSQSYCDFSMAERMTERSNEQNKCDVTFWSLVLCR